MTQEEYATLPVVEEHLRIDKRTVTTGRVKVRTETQYVDEIASALLESEAIEVERVTINQPVEQAPPVRTEGNVTIIPVLEEVLFVEKRLVLKEELHVRRRVTEERFEVPVALRKQHAVVERIDETAFPQTEEGN